MANNLKNAEKIILLFLVSYIFIRPLYASSVTVEGYTPLLSNYSSLISNNSSMSVNPSKIYYMQKALVKIRIFTAKNHPLINQQVELSSPQSKFNLTIIQPKKPTNKYGTTYGYVYSKYNKSQEYTILAIDSTYTDYTIIIKSNVNIQYLPSPSYSNTSITQDLTSPSVLATSFNFILFLINLIIMIYLIFIKKIKDNGKFKNVIRFIRDFSILYILSILILIFDPVEFNVIILSLNLILAIIYFLYILL